MAKEKVIKTGFRIGFSLNSSVKTISFDCPTESVPLIFRDLLMAYYHVLEQDSFELLRLKYSDYSIIIQKLCSNYAMRISVRNYDC